MNEWPGNPLDNFALKNSLFGATSIAKNSDKSVYIVATELHLMEQSSWGFGIDFTRNAIVHGVDNSSSYHADNRKKNVLLFGQAPTDDINDSVGTAEKKFSINFSEAKKKIWFEFALQCW